jgi:hypothetical protein
MNSCRKPKEQEDLSPSFVSGIAQLACLATGILLTPVIAVCHPTEAVMRIEIPRYSIFELTLMTARDYTNPYLLMPGDNTSPGFVVGYFTGPKGETIAIDGFWDASNSWKIRMAPTAEGSWTYTTSSVDRSLDGKTGSFTCVPSSAKGFIRVDQRHPHHFIWDDGTPFYWAPVNLVFHFDPRAAYGGSRRVDDRTFQALGDIRASQGFNVTHWGYTGFNKPQFKDKTQRNEGGPPFINYNPDLLNPAYHQFGDQRVKAIIDQGFTPGFQIGWPDQRISGMGHTRLKRYWRYLIARYAAYNGNWNLFGEADEFTSSWFQRALRHYWPSIADDYWLSIVKDYGNLTRKWDPYAHLITTHLTGGPPSTLASESWYDYIMLQLPTSETSKFLTYNKPVINAEYGGYEDFQVNGEQLRPLIWDVRMRAGYFVYESWGNDPQSAGAKYAGLVNRFFRDRTHFWLLEYHPESFDGRAGLANPGQEYVIYLPAGGTISVDLMGVAGSLPMEWYNPRTGAYSGQTTVVGGKNLAFTAPDTTDWVLHIGGVSPEALAPASPTAIRAE